MISNRMLLVVALAFGAPALQPTRADWTRFRGPNGSGISADQGKMPLRWNESANVKWKTSLPGPGVSSPIIVGDRIFVTCYSGYGIDRESPGDQTNLKRHLLCLDRQTGSIKWEKTVAPSLPEDPYEGVGVTAHGYASHTPVSDGENVYVFFGKSGALAFDKYGNQLWQTSVGKESDPRRWGSAASPILYKDLLIIPALAESEALVALDTKSGKEVWRQEAAGFSNSWSTPILVPVDDQRTDLVITVTQEVWGFDPATGKLRWFAEGAKARSFSSSPVSNGDVVYAIEGQSGVSLAVRAGGAGDVTKSHAVWTSRDSARFGSPVAHNGHIYSYASGVVSVIDASNGKRIKRVRLEGTGEGGRGREYASPIIADGKLYVVRASGATHVLRADESLEILAVNHLGEKDEVFAATPAAVNGELLIRSNKRLYCMAPMGHEVPAPAKKDEGTIESEDGDRGREGRDRRGRRGGRGFDPAAMFKQRDTNNDGKLTDEELPQRLRGRMEQLDTDKDGALTLEEFRNGMSRRGGRGRGNRDGGREGKPERPARPAMEP